MSTAAIKQIVVKRQALIKERQALQVDPDQIMSNPMAALSKMNEIKRAGELSKEIEALSDDVVYWVVETINDLEAANHG